MSNDTQTNFEIEQTFIPHPQCAEDMRHTFEEAYEIIQAYFSKKNNRLTRSIHFDMQKAPNGGEGETPARATVRFAIAGRDQLVVSTEKPEQLKALFNTCKNEVTRQALLNDARLRCQRKRGSRQLQVYLALKAPKVNGAGAEFEFEVKDQPAALRLMHDYGADRILVKTRYVKHMEIAGKMRCLELDRFGGRYKDENFKQEKFQTLYGDRFKEQDVYKLEIEHASPADFIAPEVWAAFASHDVTSDKQWRSRKLSGDDRQAVLDLEKTMRDLQERKEAEARLAGISEVEAAEAETEHRGKTRVRTGRRL